MNLLDKIGQLLSCYSPENQHTMLPFKRHPEQLHQVLMSKGSLQKWDHLKITSTTFVCHEPGSNCDLSPSADGSIYVMGGFCGQRLKLVEKYNTATDTWTALTSMSKERTYMAAVTVDSKIYVMGGQCAVNCYGTTFTLNCATIQCSVLEYSLTSWKFASS